MEHTHNYQIQYFWSFGRQGEPTGDMECVICGAIEPK